MKVTVYYPPKGDRRVIDMHNINADDEDFFVKHNVKISLEESETVGVIAYADYGKRDPEGGPEEIVEISFGRTCAETMQALRRKVEDAILRERK